MKKAGTKMLGFTLSAAMLAGCLSGCGGKPANSAAGSGSTEDGTATSEAGAGTTADEAEADSAAEEPKVVTSTYGDANGTKLELWTFVDAHAAFYGGMVDKWNTANPDRTIELTAITYPYGEMHTKLLASLNAGTGAPDICDVEVGQYPNVVNGLDTWLYPLDTAMAPYKDDMVQSRLDTYKGSDGHYYGAPFHVGATVMYYNMAELEKYNITQADVDAVVTWDDYEALGKKYVEARGEEGKYWTSVDTGSMDWLWLAMAEYGDDWTGGFDGKANVQLDSVTKMLDKQVSWLNDGIAEVSPDGHTDVEAGFQNILDHNIVSFPKAMWYMSRFIQYMPEEKGNWYIAKCPVFEAGQPCSVGIGGTGTVVTNQSEDPALAADFDCYAKMSPEGETQIWEQLGFDVCNTSLWSDDAFAHDKSNQYNTYFRNYPYDVLNGIADQIGKISVVAISPTIGDQFNLITLNDILENGKPVADALQEAQDAIDLEQ